MLILFYFFKNFIYLFIYLFKFWLCWVFVSVRGLSPVVASGGHSSSRGTGLSLLQPLLLRSTGSRRAGSVVVAHGPSCSAARGIFPDQGSNPCPLHWQADSQPLRHQGSPWCLFVIKVIHTHRLKNQIIQVILLKNKTFPSHPPPLLTTTISCSLDGHTFKTLLADWVFAPKSGDNMLFLPFKFFFST